MAQSTPLIVAGAKRAAALGDDDDNEEEEADERVVDVSFMSPLLPLPPLPLVSPAWRCSVRMSFLEKEEKGPHTRQSSARPSAHANLTS